ncbi:MAG: MFS transporter [Oscillospiraceae bacterium]
MNSKHYSRDFILVILGQIISLFGNAVLHFALPLYLLRETGSPALFGLVTACSFLPMVLLSFLGGVLADRVNKQRIMVFLDFLTAGIVLVLALILGKVPLVPLVTAALMLLYGIAGTYQPAVQASIPALVDQSRILSAGAIVSQVGALAGLLSPVLGGILFGAFGIMPILILSIFCFAASAVMELFIRIPFTRRNNSAGVLTILRSDFRDSAHYIRAEKPVLLKIIVLVALFNLVLSAMLIVGLPILVVQTLCLSDGLLGFAQGALALGGLCGGIATAALGGRLKLSGAPLLLLLCSLLVGLMALPLLVGVAPMVSYAVLTAACFFIMALATMFSVQMMAAVQRETPPELVGKVMALMLSISLCAQPLGQALYGALFGAFPQNTGVILCCVAALSAVISLSAKKVFCGDFAQSK